VVAAGSAAIAQPNAKVLAVNPRAVLGRLPVPLKQRLIRLPGRVGYGWGANLMSELRKRWILLRHPHATIRFEGPVRLGRRARVQIPGHGTLIVGPNVEIRSDCLIEIEGRGRVAIGEGTILNVGAILGCSTSLELGRRCIIGPHAYISDGSHSYAGDMSKPFMERGYDYAVVQLGDDAAVATKCTVTASVGEKSMVAANSVVRTPIPPLYGTGGVPARLIMYLGPEETEPEEGKRQRLAYEASRVRPGA